MEPLEQVTILMTLMRRLGQVMDHESAVLRSMRLDGLPDVQDEKSALAEAYEIELGRLRCSPETLGSLEPSVRSQLHDAMRSFQEQVTANLHALLAARSVVDRVLSNIGGSLARSIGGVPAMSRHAEPRGQVIPLVLDRKA